MKSPTSADPASLAALVATAEQLARVTGASANVGRLGQDIPIDLLLNMGMLVMTWAQAEVILDAGISLILHDLEGKRRLW